MNIFFLVIFFLSVFDIEVTQDKNSLKMSDELDVTLTIKSPSEYSCNIFPFLLNVANEKSRSFEVVNYSLHPSPLQIVLKLKPRSSGNLIFLPGIVSFSAQDGTLQEVLVSGVQAECKKPQIKLELAPFLPLYPESAITISRENWLSSFENMVLLEREQLRNKELSSDRSSAWTSLIILLLAGGAFALLFWVIFEIETLRKKFVPPKPKRNFQKELAELRKSSSTLPLKWQHFSILLREWLSEKENFDFTTLTTQELIGAISQAKLDDQQKTFYTNLFKRLEAIEFAGEASSEEEFQNSAKFLNF